MKYHYVISVFLLLLASCKNDSEKAFLIQHEHLNNLREKRAMDSIEIMDNIDTEKRQAQENNKLQKVQPSVDNAMAIRWASYSTTLYLDSIKIDFIEKTENVTIDKKAADKNIPNGLKKLHEVSATHTYFTDERISEIELKLNDYKKKVITLSVINTPEKVLFIKNYYGGEHKDALWLKNHFTDVPMSAAIHEITTWQIKIKDMENTVLTALFFEMKNINGAKSGISRQAATKHQTAQNAEASLTIKNQNVFYRGVDNPVILNTKHIKKEQISIDCSDCANVMYKGNGKYIIRPGKSKNISLKLSAKQVEGSVKQMDKMTFEVKNLPTPTVLFLNKKPGEIIDKKAIKSSTPIIPFMEDFNYETYVSIKGFSISFTDEKGKFITQNFTGNLINKDISAQLSKSPSGSKLILENVQCQMPDETTRKIQAVYTLK